MLFPPIANVVSPDSHSEVPDLHSYSKADMGEKLERTEIFVSITLFYFLCLSAKSTLRSLADKECAADMIFCSIQKLVTKRVTCTSEKHLGVAKTLNI